MLIIRELLTGPKRYADLASVLPGAATNLIAMRLRALERDGIAERRKPPAATGPSVYALTDVGRQLEEPLHALIRWGGLFMRERSEQQKFRPHWLAVALGAVLAAPRRGEGIPFTLACETPEGRVTMRIGRRSVRVADTDAAPDARIVGPAQAILGLASGAINEASARRMGLRIEADPSAARSLRKWLSAGRSDR